MVTFTYRNQSRVILEAAHFAAIAHGDQKRKHSGHPYITHCMSVADIVGRTYSGYIPDEGTMADMLAAAILHDVLEDTQATEVDIQTRFGVGVLELVKDLTADKTVKGNRKERKNAERIRLANIRDLAKLVKLADIVHNARSFITDIPHMDPSEVDFTEIWLNEKLAILADNGFNRIQVQDFHQAFKEGKMSASYALAQLRDKIYDSRIQIQQGK